MKRHVRAIVRKYRQLQINRCVKLLCGVQENTDTAEEDLHKLGPLTNTFQN